jgi:hypothetical protein
MTTARFGERKFGTFKFGTSIPTSPRYGLEVAWTSNGLFDGFNEGRALVDLSIERGRKYTIDVNGNSFEVEETGNLDATLMDEDRRYDVYNTNSPLFGNLAGGKLFRLQVRTPSDTIYPLMAGTLKDPAFYDDGVMPMARLTGKDGWGYLRDQANSVTVPLQETIFADDAMRLVLAQAGWPVLWGTDFDSGVDVNPYFWVEGRSAAQVLHELAHNELGTIRLAANGAMTFRSRNFPEVELLTLTSDDIKSGGIRRLTPDEAIRNLVQVSTSPRTEQSTQQVWEMPGPLQIGAGETIDDVWAEFTYNGNVVPVKNPITPVPTTDFLANSSSDGSGSNLTSNITISMSPFATRGQLTITNNGGTTAYVGPSTGPLRVRGNPIATTTTASFNYTDAESVRQFGARPFTLGIEQNVNVAKAYRDLLGIYLAQARHYLVVDLMPDWDVQFALDLGVVIRLQLTGINQLFRVIRIAHKWQDQAGIVVNTQLYLEPFVNIATGVQIPVQLPFQLGSI